MSTRATTRPTARSVRTPARAWTSGSSGTTPVCNNPAKPSPNRPSAAVGARRRSLKGDTDVTTLRGTERMTTSRNDPRSAALRGAVTVVLAVVLGSLMSTTGTARASTTSPTEATFTARLNSARTYHHLRALVVRSDLVTVARAQAARMARRSVLYHNPHLTTDVRNWRWVGENVGVGPDAAAIHTALMRSPAHRANILNRDYTEVGMGTYVLAGRVWVAQVFREPRRRASLRVAGFSHTLRPGNTGAAGRRLRSPLHVPMTSRYDAAPRRAVVRF